MINPLPCRAILHFYGDVCIDELVLLEWNCYDFLEDEARFIDWEIDVLTGWSNLNYDSEEFGDWEDTGDDDDD